MRGFHTLAEPISVTGIGLHCGLPVTARLVPRDVPGIVFKRVDLPGKPAIPASIHLVTQTVHATTLQTAQGTVSTTEHLLAALWASDVTHCKVELDGPEVPILDGSSLPWIEALGKAGIVEVAGARPVWALKYPVWVEEGGASVLGLPHHEFRVSAAVDFGHPHAGPQTIDTVITAETVASELAPARTFTLEAWLPRLREAGLIRGGSEDNAVVLRESGPSSEWRMPLEIARHKALDLVGDLALGFADSGAAFAAHLIAIRGGHGVHRKWLDECLRHGALVSVSR